MLLEWKFCWAFNNVFKEGGLDFGKAGDTAQGLAIGLAILQEETGKAERRGIGYHQPRTGIGELIVSVNMFYTSQKPH